MNEILPEGAKSDYSKLGQPLLSEADSAALDLALNRFDADVEEFRTAARNAEGAVAATLSWVGVGERLLALIQGVVARMPVRPTVSTDQGDVVARIQAKLAALTPLLVQLRTLIPGLVNPPATPTP